MKRYFIHINNKAFTLAEVLITLSIIGVVAALTIPGLLNNTNKSELKTGLHTAYAYLSQAVKQMAVDQGGSLLEKYLDNSNTFKPDFIKYFSVAKDCGVHDCVAGQYYSDVYKTYNRHTGAYGQLLDEGQFILNNGMTVLIQNSGIADRSILISVDVNGYKKGSNIWGQDLFTFELMDNDTLKPMGSEGTGNTAFYANGVYENQSIFCSKSSTSNYNGIGCTARALESDEYWDNLP